MFYQLTNNLIGETQWLYVQILDNEHIIAIFLCDNVTVAQQYC